MKRHFFQSRTLIRLSVTLSLSLLLFACNPGSETPNQPASSAFPAVDGTPPPIPDFPAQTLPTAIPGAANSDKALEREVSMADGAGLEAPMAAPTGAGSSGSDAFSDGVPRPAPMPAADKSSDDSSMPEPITEPDFPGPRPEAGLLTAGQWDDLANWPFWLNLLKNQEWSGMSDIWGLDTRQRISVMVQDDSGKPLADMPLKLMETGSQSALFQARTNTLGRAELFAGLDQPLNAGELQVVLNTGSETLEQNVSLPVSPTDPLSFTVSQKLEPAVFADLMLVMDTTGSMGDELEYLKKELQNVASRITAQNRQDLTLRLSANFYKDTTDEYIVRSFPFTTDYDMVSKQLSEQSANGGGDFPEAVDVALADAVDEHQWSPTARARLLFFVLDAPPHKDPENLERLRTSLNRAAAKGIRIIPIASSGIDKETEFLLRMMAITTGGRYVFLTSDSGIGGGHIEPTIGAHSVEKLNDLMVKIATEYITGDKAAIQPTPQPTDNQQQNDPNQQ